MIIIKSIITAILPLMSIFIFMVNPVIAKTYKIGVVLPLSGDKADTGQNLLNAIKLSVNQVKKEQGINFELIIKDDKNDADEAQKVAEELVQEPNLISIIGHYYSSTAIGATKIYDQAKIPTICVYASDPKVGESSPYVFSINYSNQEQAEYMAVYIKEIFKKNNVLVINNNNAFGLSLAESFINKANKLGLTIFKQLEYDHVKKFGNEFIASNLPDKEANKNIGAVVIFSHSGSGIKLVKQVRQHEIEATIIGPNTWSTNNFLDEEQIDEELTRDVYVTSPFLWEIGNYRAFKFAKDFKESYKEEPNITAPMCYDAVFLLANAIKEKGEDREKIKDFIASLTWKSAVPGITGNIFFNKSRMMDRNVFISEIKDGRFKVAYIQLLKPREPYVFKQKDMRLEKGYLIEVDGQLYHWVDVIFVGVDFFRVNDVNTQKMNFDIEFYLWFKWMSDKIDISQVDILNAFSGTSILIKEDIKRPVKYKCTRYKGSYVNPYDLSKFPFDTQSLPITIGHKSKNSSHIMIVPDARHMTNNPVKEIYPQEWTYIDKNFSSGLHRFDSTFGDPDYRMGKGYKSKIYFSTLTVSITLKRIIFPYIVNLFIPLAIILIIAVLITKIPVEQFVLRSNLSMTSLLSILLYHMAQKNTLPKVGYLMKVDYYFITTYFFILLIIAINVTSTIYIQKKENETAVKLNRRFQFVAIPIILSIYVCISIFL
ncbi:MAG: ABC transporter substrate-binding protein [Desulfamplus sp.]|nr:ABC transporter substrate-binding protein [Desulfamplus sp.]